MTESSTDSSRAIRRTDSRTRTTNEGPRGSTVDGALRWGTCLLTPSRTASLDAQLLLAHVLGRPRSWLFGHGDVELTESQGQTYGGLLHRRVAGEPVAYLRGFVEWFGLRLAVSPSVLVPRPETELLAEMAIDTLNNRSMESIADVGTGSGAIAIAVASKVHDIQVTAIDSEPNALAVARENIERHHLADRIRLVKGHLIDSLETCPDLIVSNLPYLSTSMMSEIDDNVRHEPASALLAGSTGLELYTELFRQLNVRSWHVPVLFEIDPRQSERARALALDAMPGAAVRIVRDYAGLDRIVMVGG